MIFTEVEDNPCSGLSHRRVSENGLIEIGVYKVLFGHRVRAGFVGSLNCEIDWCGGSQWHHVEVLYSICVGILSKREETRDAFKGIPGYSSIKPFYRDGIFLVTVGTLAGNCPPIRLKQGKAANF